MPEAAINEHRDLETGPGEVWTPLDRPLFAVTAQARRPQEPTKSHLRGAVSSGTN